MAVRLILQLSDCNYMYKSFKRCEHFFAICRGTKRNCDDGNFQILVNYVIIHSFLKCFQYFEMDFSEGYMCLVDCWVIYELNFSNVGTQCGICWERMSLLSQ